MGFKDSVLPKLTMGVGKFSENRYVKVICYGMMAIMPISLVGSFATIFAGLPFVPASVRAVCLLGTQIASNLITVYTVIALAAVMAKECKQDVITSVIMAMACFFILTPIRSFEKIQAIEVSYLGSKGMFVGIIVAMFSARLYAFLIEKRIFFRMPEAVPRAVAKSFEDIVPAFILLVTALVLNVLFKLTPYGNMHDIVYTFLQRPLQSLGSSIWSAVLLMMLAELLWFFGIHGSLVTSSILTALFATQAYANMEAVAAGLKPEFILNQFFMDSFKGPRALALALLLLFSCRSGRLKTIGKIAIFPSFFGITEPMKFGIPMVMNPWLLIPMTFSAVVSILIAYFATLIGFLPIISLNVSRMIPPVVQGFMVAGWRGALIQIIQLVVIILMYIPFLRKVDHDDLAAEKQGAAAA
ncbi:PTS system, IIc component [Treponema primitia ZAS-2]|uniref:Permease IIC component n=1 Tax=Treponema primitia (strain ATCC BAA-887 / DSM 12427 / ZAS-2) TaxID=545694 RepID=F5YLG9_TREPZ|nr:PTS transporter subunit EIIC [Treponema primitia]AEF85529.1 PTS system, IIc component [Treponema primitia ZAS-2]